MDGYVYNWEPEPASSGALRAVLRHLAFLVLGTAVAFGWLLLRAHLG